MSMLFILTGGRMVLYFGRFLQSVRSISSFDLVK